MKTIKNKFGRVSYSFEKDFVHIFDLYILYEYRRKGHAKELLLKAIKSIRKTGYKGNIDIVADPQENSISIEKLIEFYESLGLIVYSYYS